MEYRVLPGTDLRVSRIGFGCWLAGGHGWGTVDDRESVAAIRAAHELGITMFDTSDIYGLGHAEEVLSEALGEGRHEVVISTKFGLVRQPNGQIGRDASRENVLRSINASLARLRISTIPLAYLHWPDPATLLEETAGALDECVRSGKVRYTGCSNFSPAQLPDVHRGLGVAAVQFPLNLFNRESDTALLQATRKLGASGIAFDVLAKGLLSGKFGPGARFGADDIRSRDPEFLGERFLSNLSRVEALKQVSSRLGRSPSQVAIRWVLEQPGVDAVVVGARTPAQVQDNVGACGWTLSAGDSMILNRAFETKSPQLMAASLDDPPKSKELNS